MKGSKIYIMINEELKTFINKMRATGQTDELIGQSLAQSGWRQSDIQAALTDDVQPPQQSESPKKLNINGALLGGLLGLFLGIIPAIFIAVYMEGNSVVFWMVVIIFTTIFTLIGAKRPIKQLILANQAREKLWFETTWAGLLLPLILSGIGVGILVFCFIKNKKQMPFVLKLWLLIQIVLFGALLFVVLSTLVQKIL